MVTLASTFTALGYKTPEQQRGVIEMLRASGALDETLGRRGVPDDAQADNILANLQFVDSVAAAHWLHNTTQATMLRPKGTERWQCQDGPYLKEHRAELLNKVRDAGMLSETMPKHPHYDHVLLLGHDEGSYSTRLDTLKQVLDSGVRVGAIHLLGSDRKLDLTREPIANVKGENGNTLTTEMQMMLAHYHERSAKWPKAQQAIPTYEINTLHKPDNRHINTKDTIETWLEWRTRLSQQKENPVPLKGRVLVISNQPHVAYQDAAVKSVLPASFSVETIGARVPEEHLAISATLDNFARQIDVNFLNLLSTLEKEAPAATPPAPPTTLPANERAELHALLKKFGASVEQEQRLMAFMERDGLLPTPQSTPPKVVKLNPKDIRRAPEDYQFRSGGDKNGVTQTRRVTGPQQGPKKPIVVHECLEAQPNGSIQAVYYLVDGHHRLEAAGDQPIDAIVLGSEYTKRDAKIAGAFMNMKEDIRNARDIRDAARALKEAESANQALLPALDTTQGDLAVAKALKNVPGDMLDDITRKITAQLPDPHKQKLAMKAISTQLGAMLTPAQQAKAAPTPQPTSFTQRTPRHDSAPDARTNPNYAGRRA